MPGRKRTNKIFIAVQENKQLFVIWLFFLPVKILSLQCKQVVIARQYGGECVCVCVFRADVFILQSSLMLLKLSRWLKHTRSHLFYYSDYFHSAANAPETQWSAGKAIIARMNIKGIFQILQSFSARLPVARYIGGETPSPRRNESFLSFRL